MWTVVIRDLKGQVVGQHEFSSGSLTIGRDEGRNIVLPTKLASRKHARLDLINGTPVIVDEGSSNGTLVNGLRITAPTRLDGNCAIDIAEFRISLVPQAEDDGDSTVLMSRARPQIPPPPPRPSAPVSSNTQTRVSGIPAQPPPRPAAPMPPPRPAAAPPAPPVRPAAPLPRPAMAPSAPAAVNLADIDTTGMDLVMPGSDLPPPRPAAPPQPSAQPGDRIFFPEGDKPRAPTPAARAADRDPESITAQFDQRLASVRSYREQNATDSQTKLQRLHEGWKQMIVAMNALKPRFAGDKRVLQFAISRDESEIVLKVADPYEKRGYRYFMLSQKHPEGKFPGALVVWLRDFGRDDVSFEDPKKAMEELFLRVAGVLA